MLKNGIIVVTVCLRFFDIFYAETKKHHDKHSEYGNHD